MAPHATKSPHYPGEGMNLDNLTKTLDLLGLTGSRFSVAQKKGDKLVSQCFDDPATAARWIEGTDAYITPNPVKAGVAGKPSNDDILRASWLLVDADPKKDDQDPTGTSPERRDEAFRVADGVFQEFRGAGSAIFVDSGRGCQVWLKLDPMADRRRILAWIRQVFGSPLVEIDATHEVSRLQRLPGTTNSRTGEEVYVIDSSEGGAIPSSVWAELLEGFVAPEAMDLEVPPADRSEPTRRDLTYVRRDGDARVLWSEDPMESTLDRSKRDYLFLVALLEQGAPLEAASRLLHALPGAKAATRSDDAYWLSTARSALRRVGEIEARSAALDGLVEKIEKDPLFATNPNVVAALADLKARDLGAFLRIRGEIKPAVRKAVGVMGFDELIQQEEKAQKAARLEGPPDSVAVYVQAKDAGKGLWYTRNEKGGWGLCPFGELLAILKASGLDPVEDSVRAARTNPFSVTCAPFQPRTLPGRVWNISDARFAVEPVEGKHETFDQLLRVVGRGLTPSLKGSKWAQENGILTGADYLRVWLATMLQDPASRRAYLVLFSQEQGTGKSMFFESMRLLIGDAVAKANLAFTSTSGFNGELQGAVLAYTEEVRLSGKMGVRAYNRLKDWTLSEKLTIHPKGKCAVDVPNVLSWGQCTNDSSYVPVFAGDDRITIVEVQPPREEERAPKAVMMARLAEEAPAFLHTLLNLEVPKPLGRYAVPPIETEVKKAQVVASSDELEVWLGLTPGWILMDDEDIVDSFRDYLARRDFDKRFWTRARILRKLPSDRDIARALFKWFQGQEAGTTKKASEVFEVFPDRLRSAHHAGKLLRLLVAAPDSGLQTRTHSGVRVYVRL